MLNKERVILMTKMASYEEHEGKKNASVMNYFRGDYVWFQVLKSTIYGTIAFGIMFGMYIFYDFEIFMTDIYKMDLFQFGKSILVKYLFVIGIYAIISYAVYSYRYAKAQKKMKLYMSNLNRLTGMYDKT
ncbi:hypothetical protein EDD76_104212 [Kineothrix alysoides]|uniref:Uncharacterized protein n=1 Tax=Kineothrix alysoides TaxID=1469948 RepID=A0A4R1R281_9FIRM|nr:hypothetical protein [Kineothrix alysoides]TCL59475.1 hypothetical protein EDD76_104212 [Kineothrix alysoides]